jgi:CheY-like chemotaxis protein
MTLRSEARSRTILVVDDAEECVATLDLALQSLPGVVIVPAYSAEAALALLDSASISKEVHAVITDVRLPEMNGLDLITRILEQPRFQALPIVVVSADTDPATPARALGLGARAYFSKPFSPVAVRKKLEELINGHELHAR